MADIIPPNTNQPQTVPIPTATNSTQTQVNPQTQPTEKPKEGPVGSVTIESISTNPAVPEPKQESPLPKKLNGNAKYIFILLGVVALVVIAAEAFMVFSNSDKKTQKKSTSQQAKIQETTDDKFEKDSDNDSVPDFVETGINTNPNSDECLEKTGCSANLEQAEKTQGNLLFILDSSGSMAEKIGGVAKMDTAKNALKTYIDKISEKTNLGLMVYGHKGNNTAAGKAISCAGIELLYPISSPDKITFKARIDSFSPTGYTPIADSLKQAQTAFSGKDGQTNRILLISDGIETCDGKPAEAAADLKQAGIAVTIDVIGFAVDAATKAQLQQVTQVSGGTYYEANTTEDFINVFDTISKNVSSLFEQGSCLSQNYMEYNSCLADYYMRALSFLNTQVANPQDPSEVDRITNLITKISSKYSELSGQSGADYQRNINQNSSQYNDQINQQPTP